MKLRYAKDSGRLYAMVLRWCTGKTKKQINDQFDSLKANPRLLNDFLTENEKELIRNGQTLDMMKEFYDMGYLL
jgi:hypothetical protein